ncbi:MAG: ATP-binding protein [Pseudomonadota bacterium]
MQFSQFFRSATFRLTLIATGTLALVMIMVLLLISQAGGLIIRLALEAELDDELSELQESYEAGGLDRLLRELEQEDEEFEDEGLSFRLADNGNGLIAGDLELATLQPGRSEIIPAGNDPDEPRLVHTVQLGPELWLAMSVDGEVIHDTLELVAEGSFWLIAISVPLALLSGLLLARMVLVRIQGITKTAETIRAGGLDQRVPVRGSSDEFDQLAQSINAMLDSIEDLTKDIENVTIGIAHDLRSPLSRLHNKLELINRDETTFDERKALIDDANAEIRGLLGTFDALMRIAQIEAGTRRAGFRRIDLSELLAEITETFEPVIAADGRVLDRSITPGLMVQGDRALITQMVANILENAIEHTPPGTKVSVKLAEEPGHAKLTIADDGPGVPETERGEVFKRFYRLDRSRGSKGSGLGLSLVRSIAKLHDIKVEARDHAPGLEIGLDFARS